MLTAQGGDCAIYHGLGLESAPQFPVTFPQFYIMQQALNETFH
jgi:hypothetical protein